MEPLMRLVLEYAGELATAGIALLIRQIEIRLRFKKKN